jgi:hypothetical protein
MLDHLGDALYRGGSPAEARECWEKAAGLTAPDHDPPPDAEQRRLHAKLEAKLKEAAKGGKVVTAPLAPTAAKAASTQPSEENVQPEERKDADL